MTGRGLLALVSQQVGVALPPEPSIRGAGFRGNQTD